MIMMIITILLWSVLACSVNNQEKIVNDSVIYWDKQTKLIWGDFQGVPSEHDLTTYGIEAMAASAVEIGYYSILSDGKIDIKVYCRFVKNKSWTTDTTSKNLLAHEQLHFDIGELFARKIRKEICLLKKEGVKEYDVYKQKINGLLKVRDLTDVEYDKKTLNGAIDFVQEQWNKKIAKEIKELKEYAVDYEKYLKDDKKKYK